MHFLFLDFLGLSLFAGVEIVVNSGIFVPTCKKKKIDFHRRPILELPIITNFH